MAPILIICSTSVTSLTLALLQVVSGMHGMVVMNNLFTDWFPMAMGCIPIIYAWLLWQYHSNHNDVIIGLWSFDAHNGGSNINFYVSV